MSNAKRREELLEQYGVPSKKNKAPLPKFAEVQESHLKSHAPVVTNGVKTCGVCTETIGGVVSAQKYPCASLQRVGLGNG